MLMPVVKIGIMRVGMAQWLMAMPMGVRFGHYAFVVMLMVFIVEMAVFMVQQAVIVLMNMALGQMEPKSDCHQHACRQQLPCHALVQQYGGDDRPDEGRQ